MKRVLFDQNVPGSMRHLLKACSIRTVNDMGWGALKNGRLLRAAEDAGFEVLLSCDRTKIGVVSMSENHWPLVKPYADDISAAIAQVNPGEVLEVYTGTFVPVKHRKPGP